MPDSAPENSVAFGKINEVNLIHCAWALLRTYIPPSLSSFGAKALFALRVVVTTYPITANMVQVGKCWNGISIQYWLDMK